MLIPVFIKSWLEKQPLYLRIRYSLPIIKIWLLIRKDSSLELKKQKALYQSTLPSSTKLIFDAGAQEGFVTQLFADFASRVIAIEPSHRNVAILKSRFRHHPNVIIQHAALSNHKGHDYFYECSRDYALGTLSKKWKAVREEALTNKLVYGNKSALIQTTTLDSLIEHFGQPDFIKIDVEGFEETVLKGLTQKVPLLSFEAILPYFLIETNNCIEHLSSLATHAEFNYAIDHRMVHATFIKKEELLKEIESLKQTIEIFCRLN